tara:strand:+ start:349 stop:639 length:291 start_codon:yes stop_codon:yes gene_type:complete
LDVAASVMVMADRGRIFGGPIHARIGYLGSYHMNMICLVIVHSRNEDVGGPISGMVHSVLCLRHAMQVHGRQKGDAQTDAKMANSVRQGLRLLLPV